MAEAIRGGAEPAGCSVYFFSISGIRVQLSDTTSAESAFARLQDFTAIEGLSYSPLVGSPSFRFTPVHAGVSRPG
ncbi:hypothetical protein GCM10010170_103200 [Dactylosporangium salmoneum]|uniref:Uncharacterized protein n=1 Tax=Dactylosporangium salmoneum TaxID=53361 RepID=A0ABP5UZY8_9ACTN